MSRDWMLFLEDIIQSCEKITRYTAGMKKDSFLAEGVVFDAVLRNLEIISEASHHLPEDVLATLSGIDWRKIKGLRIILAHCYFRVDPEILWDVVTSKVPLLLEKSRSLHDSSS